jgi:predicted ribosome-associated RNA-binding protein Tma20
VCPLKSRAMFRKEKDITERTKSFLKNKEVRSLRQRLAALANPSTGGAATEDSGSVNFQEILPEKGNVSIIKLMTKTLVYSVDQIPYFFDLLDRNDLYPTVFTLFRFPSMLRPILIYQPVSEYLLNGADLMLPGVAYIPGHYLILPLSLVLINHQIFTPSELVKKFAFELWGILFHLPLESLTLMDKLWRS